MMVLHSFEMLGLNYSVTWHHIAENESS